MDVGFNVNNKFTALLTQYPVSLANQLGLLSIFTISVDISVKSKKKNKAIPVTGREGP
jgi:hypothetical protein